MSTCFACKGKGMMQGRACKRASVIGSKKRAALGIGRKAWVISNAIWSQGSWPICCYCTWHGPLTCSHLMMLPRGQGFTTFNILRLNLFARKHIHNIQKEQTNSIQKYKTWKYGCQHSPCTHTHTNKGTHATQIFFKAPSLHTCTNDLLDLHSGDVNLLCKFPYSFVGVLIGKGIYVDLHPRGAWEVGRAAQWGGAVRHVGSQREF